MHYGSRCAIRADSESGRGLQAMDALCLGGLLPLAENER